MSLQEEFNRARQEKNAQTKKEERIRDMEQLLPEEVHNLFSSYHIANAYQGTLPRQLAPDARDLISEMIMLCPPECWIAPPANVDITKILLHESPGKPSWYSYYSKIPEYYAQYCVSDGSVHIGRYDLNLKKEIVGNLEVPFRFTRYGKQVAREEALAKLKAQIKETFLQEIQETLDKCNHDIRKTGAREFFVMTYSADGWDGNGNSLPSNKIIVFRDGVVYDPYRDAYHKAKSGPSFGRNISPLVESCHKDSVTKCLNSEEWYNNLLSDFQRYCSVKVRDWAIKD